MKYYKQTKLTKDPVESLIILLDAWRDTGNNLTYSIVSDVVVIGLAIGWLGELVLKEVR